MEKGPCRMNGLLSVKEPPKTTWEVLDLCFCVILLFSFCTSFFISLLISQSTSSVSFILSGIGISMEPVSLFRGCFLELKIENLLVKTFRTFSSETNTTRKSGNNKNTTFCMTRHRVPFLLRRFFLLSSSRICSSSSTNKHIIYRQYYWLIKVMQKKW